MWGGGGHSQDTAFALRGPMSLRGPSRQGSTHGFGDTGFHVVRGGVKEELPSWGLCCLPDTGFWTASRGCLHSCQSLLLCPAWPFVWHRVSLSGAGCCAVAFGKALERSGPGAAPLVREVFGLKRPRVGGRRASWCGVFWGGSYEAGHLGWLSRLDSS